MKWGHFKTNVKNMKMLNLSSVYSGLPLPWYCEMTATHSHTFLTAMIITKILLCKILKKNNTVGTNNSMRTKYISKMKELIHMSWHIYRWERITALSSTVKHKWPQDHSWLDELVVWLGGDLTILRLSLVSKYQARPCGISLLMVPYVSFPLHCLPRVKSYFGPLYPLDCYGNPWEAPGLVPPPGVPEPSWTSHHHVLACFMPTRLWARDFPDSSVGKESTCNARDPSSISGSGRSAGEGTGYPLQYSWASLVAQLVKIHLQCRRPGFDPWVGKIPWRRDRLPIPVFWPGEFHGLYSPWGPKESDMTKRLSLSLVGLATVFLQPSPHLPLHKHL